MSNALKGETPLVLGDGREFTLVLDHEALLGIEGSYGKPLPRVMAEAAEGFLSATAAIAQAAFTRHHPDMTRGDVLKIVMSGDQEKLTEALAEASAAAFPDQEPAGNAPAPKVKKTPRGKTAGRSGASTG